MKAPLYADDPRDAWWKRWWITRGWRGELLVACAVYGLSGASAAFIYQALLHGQPVGLK